MNLNRMMSTLRRELREALVKLTMAAGMILGFVWALRRPEPEPAASCGPDRLATESIGACVGDSLLTTVIPFVAAVGIGLLAGTLLGVVLSRLLLPEPTAKVATVPAGRTDAGRWIVARFAGSCARCRRRIEPGDRILHAPRRTTCADCAG